MSNDTSQSIQFVKNIEDLSTDQGYQFKFHCDLCGNGYMSTFKASKLAIGSQILRIASSFLGGGFSRMAHGTYEVQRMVGGKAHDDAMREAVNEIRPQFKQCTRCGRWVCPQVCWNNAKGLCKECAPDIRNEVAAAQAQAATEQIHAKARTTNMIKDIDLTQDSVAACPACGALVGNSKFCPECGTPVAQKEKCAKCGAEVTFGTKFCPECGEPIKAKL